MNNYQITKQTRLHHPQEDWSYQFSEDGEYGVDVSFYSGGLKKGESFYIPKDCLEQFIQILQEFK